MEDVRVIVRAGLDVLLDTASNELLGIMNYAILQILCYNVVRFMRTRTHISSVIYTNFLLFVLVSFASFSRSDIIHLYVRWCDTFLFASIRK